MGLCLILDGSICVLSKCSCVSSLQMHLSTMSLSPFLLKYSEYLFFAWICGYIFGAVIYNRRVLFFCLIKYPHATGVVYLLCLDMRKNHLSRQI